MSITRPFHRNVRGMKDGPNSGYSGWAYLRDRAYAKSPEHYVRAFLLIQNDLQALFEYIEPSEESKATYSFRIHALLMRACIEIEANFKAIFEENCFTPPANRSLSMNDYRKVDATHHLSSYEVMLPIWNGQPPVLRPFQAWRAGRGLANPGNTGLPWYQAYNASKHDRQDEFRKANMEHLISAVAALLVLISSQFKGEDFTAGSDSLVTEGDNYYPMEAATGSLFRIKYPDDWSDDEIYDFDWSALRNNADRFQAIDFSAIPS